MTEINISVEAELKNDSEAKSFVKKLKTAAKDSQYDFYKSLNNICSMLNDTEYDEVNIDDISRTSNCAYISLYSGRISSVSWIALALSKLGAKKVYMKELWDEGSLNHYFLNGESVCKNAYEGKEVKKLSPEDIEINKKLFLPEGRVKVRATLESYEDISKGKGNKLLMEFLTSRNNKFYYSGGGELTELVSEDYDSLTEFTATFERGKLNGEYVSFAKRPTGIAYTFNEDVMRKKHPEMFHKKLEDLDTIAKCPSCGGSLRTEKAKQCPHCYESWRD